VPHATAAILARSMLPPAQQPRVVTTLHGTDTTLLGADPGYGPAIHHALTHSDAVTTVSNFLKQETQRVLGFEGPMEVIHNSTVAASAKQRFDLFRDLPAADFTVLVQALRMNDAVKFAKYQPGAAENEQALETIKKSVQQLDTIIS